MRSSFYQTLGRFSRASSARPDSERPFSPASAFSEDTDGSALPAPLRNKKANPTVPPPPPQPPKTQPSNTNNNNARRNSSNQVQPVSEITYSKTARASDASKRGQPLENTRIHNVHEDDHATVDAQRHRF